MGKVNASAINQTVAPARYFPMIALQVETGNVPSNSIVPVRCSSAHNFMPTAGASSM